MPRQWSELLQPIALINLQQAQQILPLRGITVAYDEQRSSSGSSDRQRKSYTESVIHQRVHATAKLTRLI